MNKKLSIIISLILITAAPIYSSEEADFILGESYNGVWSTTEETALAVLALSQEPGYSSRLVIATSNLENYLRDCVEDDTCKIKETYLSLLALKKAKPSSTVLDDAATWLLNARTIQYTGDLEGWLVQIISPSSGICKIENPITQIEKPITVESGHTPWFEISPDLLSSNTESLELDCSTLTLTPTLSLIQRKPQTISDQQLTVYYIKQQSKSKKLTVEFGNPCWGNSYRGVCNSETTAFVLYTLKQLGKTPDPTWLTQQQLTPLENALLFKVTNDNKYLTALKSQQSANGYWGSQDLHSTAWIYYLLKPASFLEKTELWIESRKDPSDTCWPKYNCDTKTTSLVVLSSSFEPTPSTTTYTPPDDTNVTTSGTGTTPTTECETKSTGDTCTTDQACRGKCNYYDSCDDIQYDNCPEGDVRPDVGGEECQEGTPCVTTENCDGTCNFFGDCIDTANDNCPFTGEPQEPEEPQEEESSVFFWIFITLIILLILAGAAYLAYQKGLLDFSSKKPKPTAKYKPLVKKPQPYHPPMAARKKPHPFAKHMEKALDKSMDELESLLKTEKK